MPGVLSPFLCVWTGGCFYLLTLEKSPAVNGDVRVALRNAASSSYGCQVRSAMAASRGKSVSSLGGNSAGQMGHYTFPPRPCQGSGSSRSSPTQAVVRCLVLGSLGYRCCDRPSSQVSHDMSLSFDLFSVTSTGAELVLRSLVAFVYLWRNVFSRLLSIV